ncbi:MAG: alkaline phosphatase D family protein [Verrucomicrobiales bacterium]
MRVFVPLFLAVLFGFPDANGQHDGQRDAVWEVARGDAEAFARRFMNPRGDAGMAETHYVGMLMLLTEGKVDEALAVAGEALEVGLPPERLLAEPLELLEKLHDHPDFDSLPGIADAGPILHGPMLGDLTDEGVSVWIRTRNPRELRLLVTDSGNNRFESEPVSTTKASGFAGVLKIEGLKPDTTYEGAIVVPDLPDDPLDRFSFTTRPEAGTADSFKVAFGGGAGYVPRWEYMWDTIAAFEPDALLMLGDNVYIDDPEHLLTNHYCYARRQSRPEWRRLIRGVPVYSIYDDHDFGENDCIPGPDIETPAWKREVWNVFRQNWANPGYGGGEEQPGCWYDFSIGDVDFFMLDGRYYRDLKGGSMLGPVQKQWLLDAVGESEATFKVIVSPVPFTPDVKPGSRDPWDGFPEEREEIFAFIESEKIDGVFLIAADRHRTDLRTIERENGYTLYEFESSRLTNRHTHKVVETQGLIWGYNEQCSFGLMEFDTTADDPQVTFRCINIDGEEQESHVLRSSELRHGE